MRVRRPARVHLALAALSASCFVSVTSENLPVALLPQLAAGFGVTESAVGLLVTGYAVVVAVSVVPLVALATRWDRRITALVTITAIVVSNLVLAVAPGYGIAVVARVVSAVGHGVFWSVVAPIAVGLLGPERVGRATAVVFAGNSLAFLLGLPLSSWLGGAIGWRLTTVAVAGVAALSALAIFCTVDPLPPGEKSAPAKRSAVRPDREAGRPSRWRRSTRWGSWPRPCPRTSPPRSSYSRSGLSDCLGRVRRGLGGDDRGGEGRGGEGRGDRQLVLPTPQPRQPLRQVVDNPAVAGVNLVTAIVITGQFAAFTFITVIIARYVRLDSDGTSALLFAYGAAGLIGLWLIGRFVDNHPRATALVVTAGLSLCMLVPLISGPGVLAGAAVVLWGLPAAGMAVVLQAAVLRAAPEQPDLASALYIVAFQLGIAAGAWIGGVFVDRDALAMVLAVAAAAGLLATLIVRRSAAFSAIGRSSPRDRPRGATGRHLDGSGPAGSRRNRAATRR